MFRANFHLHRHKNTYFLISLIILVLSIAIGCGSSDHHKGLYVIAYPTDWEKINVAGDESNLSGLSFDLLYEIGKQEEFDVQFIAKSGSPIPLLDKSDIDGVLSSLAPSPINRKQYLFSNPYFTIGIVLVVRQDSQYHKSSDLSGKIIGFDRNTNWDLKVHNNVDITFQPYDSVNIAIENLMNRYVDGIVLDSVVAHRLISGLFKNHIRMVGDTFRPVSLRLVVKKDKSSELITLFNNGLKSIIKDGLYDKMLDYWAVPYGEVKSSPNNKSGS